jgi:SAM-dependent methyltransferase
MEAAARWIDHGGVRRVLDVGAGTGTVSFRWARRYPEAEVVALDANPAMTTQIASRTTDEHIKTMSRPLQDIGDDVGSVDLAWAASVFHELDDPAEAFSAMRRVIRPDGVLAIMEMDTPPHVLPVEHGGLELRLQELAHADAPGSDWTEALSAASFELLEKRTLTSDHELPADGVGGAYARAELRRLYHQSGDGLGAEQQHTLSRILHPDAAGQVLSSVHIRGTRSLWIARRL